MEKFKAFFHKHPIESALLGGVALIALYIAIRPSSNNSGASQEAALQNAYFQAESIQAQSNAAVQIAGITTSAQTVQTQIAANVSTHNADTYAALDQAVNESNNQAAVAALPYQEESYLIQALSGVAGQTQTSTINKANSGFLGIGASQSSTTTTTPTTAASHAADYLNELVNGLFASNG